uniref:preprotein translocase subunit G n=1 Tax=Pseudoerythrocladia kornmannii TaxID=753682 RepID=UPI001FCD980B|nr:preprotein translocase subunit G [Pseudoerythrocladia kornmannii]UNJ16718.1 preprotein translocase subunit G [Pseudoerythrocladia kornmannii]
MPQFINIVWYFVSILLIFIIMIQNPKAEGAGVTNQILTSDSNIKKRIVKTTWFLIIIFLILTGIFAHFNIIY